METHSRAISHSAHSAERKRADRNKGFVLKAWKAAKDAIEKAIEATTPTGLKKAAVAVGMVVALGGGMAACSSESPNHDTNTDSDTDAEVTDGETDGDALPDIIEDPVDDEIEDGDADEDGEVIPPVCPEQEGPLELVFNTDNAGTARTVVTFEGPDGEEVTADAELTVSMEGDISGLTYIGTCDDGETPVYLASPDDSLEFEPQIVSEVGDLGDAGWDATIPESECEPLESDATTLRTSGSTTKPIAKNATSVDGATRALFELMPDLSTYGLYVDGVETSGAFSLASAGFSGHAVVAQIGESEWTLGVTTFFSGGSNEYAYTGTMPAASSKTFVIYSMLPEAVIVYPTTIYSPALEYHFFRCGPGTPGGSLDTFEMVFEVLPTSCMIEDGCGCAGDGVVPVVDNASLDIRPPHLAGFYSISGITIVPVSSMGARDPTTGEMVPGQIILSILRTNVDPGYDEGEETDIDATVNYHTVGQYSSYIGPSGILYGTVRDAETRAPASPSYESDAPAGCVLDM